MTSKRNQLLSSKIYAIVSPESYAQPKDFEDVCRALIENQADILQLRSKDSNLSRVTEWAIKMRQWTRNSATLFIVNDYPQIARDVAADGVHVGQDDMSVTQARAIVHPSQWVGQSTHSLDQALRAEKEGADYIGYGPIFATPTKATYQPVGLHSLPTIEHHISIPFFAIGGIDTDNAKEVIEKGASRLAIVRALSQVSHISTHIQQFRKLLNTCQKHPANQS